MTVVIKHLGLVDYESTYQAMQEFTDKRTPETPDEIWLLQHPPVYTQGRNGDPQHLLNPGEIPVVQIDRGGQVTYHGPGQLVVYLMLDLKRLKIGVKELVFRIEQSVISLLDIFGIKASNRKDAPGVYVNNAKIAALGLRIKHGYSYHGLSLNVDMDLMPFSNINPCGYDGLNVIDLKSLKIPYSIDSIESQLVEQLLHQLNYSSSRIV